MKKLAVTLITLVAVINCFCLPAYAGGQASLSFEYEKKDDKLSVVLDLKDNDTIEMMQLCIKYDEDVLLLGSASAGNAFSGFSFPTISTNEPGSVYIVWDDLKPISDGQILVLDFTIKSSDTDNISIYIDRDYDNLAADNNYENVELVLDDLTIDLSSDEKSEDYHLDPIVPDTQEQEGSIDPETEDSGSEEKDKDKDIPQGDGSDTQNRSWIIFAISGAALLVIAFVCLFVRKRKSKEEQ